MAKIKKYNDRIDEDCPLLCLSNSKLDEQKFDNLYEPVKEIDIWMILFNLKMLK